MRRTCLSLLTLAVIAATAFVTLTPAAEAGTQPSDGPRVVTFAMIEFVPNGAQHWHREPMRFSGCWSYERPAPGDSADRWLVRVRTTDGVDRVFAVPDRAVTVCEGVAHLPAGTGEVPE